MDFTAPSGTDVYATGNGVVLLSSLHRAGLVKILLLIMDSDIPVSTGILVILMSGWDRKSKGEILLAL